MRDEVQVVGRVGADAGDTDDAIRLSEVARHPSVEGAVEAVREFLGMEIAFTGEFTDGHQIFRVMRGESESFGVHEGMALPLDQTYCQRVMDGRLPNLIADVRADDRASSLPISQAADVGIADVRADDRASSLPISQAADVGAFVSVPLHFSDGRFYGTLCAGSHDAQPSLGYRELQFLHVFARIVADQLERDEIQRLARGSELRAATAQALIAAVEARDSYTGEHSSAVVSLAEAVARQLGLSDEVVADVKHVALLPDIGKIAIPDAILRKHGPLSDDEWEIMRSHPISSERIVQNVPGLEHLAPAIRAEHERWDGTGYPDGLVGEAIPVTSRITLVCDAYHAMTSNRPTAGL